ncbi:MAG: DUF433 domain-containing protein [Planctomycetia bacterium]|nr:DUF433 domain-containing protein [Planctomycetia bacterium]
MPPLQQLFKQIAEKAPVEHEQLAFALSEDMLSFQPFLYRWLQRQHAEDYPSIVATPGVCGDAARLIRTRIPVWAVEHMRQLGFSEIDILRSYPTLRAAHFVQAWSYAPRHRSEIEQVIRENEDIADDAEAREKPSW